MNFNIFKKKKPEVKETEPVKESTSIYVKYSYEWKDDVPENERNTSGHPSRPFCIKLMELSRLYSRADIEKISERLGYSVFDRCGGEECRHYWKSNIVVKKS